MFRASRTCLALAIIAFGLAAHPALSQGLGSAELWASWQSTIDASGGVLTAGAEKREGNKLVLSDVTLQTGAEEERHASFHLEQLTLVNLADGSVGVALPERFPLRVRTPDSGPDGDDREGAEKELRFMVAAPGLDLAIHGISPRRAFNIKAPSLSVTLDGVVPPVSLNNEDLALMLGLADLNLSYAEDLSTASISVVAEASVGTIHGEVRFKEDEGSHGSLILDLAGGQTKLTGAVPPDAAAMFKVIQTGEPSFAQLLEVLEAGAFFDMHVSLAQSEFQIDVTNPDKRVELKVAVAGAKGGSRLDRNALAYDYGLQGLTLEFPATSVELPEDLGRITISLAEFSQILSVGLDILNGPQNWRYKLLVDKLDLPSAFWDMMDANQIVPRDPISVSVDLTGTYGIMPEALAPGWTPKPDTAEPLNALSFKLDDLSIEGLGAAFAGQGGLSFDFGDLTVYEGLPTPEGELTFTTKGVYALIDRAVAAGLLTDKETPGLRAGIMVIAKAGADPDTLISQLKFEGRSFFLNGMKMR